MIIHTTDNPIFCITSSPVTEHFALAGYEKCSHSLLVPKTWQHASSGEARSLFNGSAVRIATNVEGK